MSANNLIRRLMTRAFRGQKTSPIRKNSGSFGLRLEELEVRAVMDSGGAAGQLASGNLVDQSQGTMALVPNVAIQPIYLTDSKSHQTQDHTNFDNYLNDLVSSGFITSILSQYSTGVTTIGEGTVGANDLGVKVTPKFDPFVGGLAISDSDIQAIVQAQINAGKTSASDGLNNFYVVFTPPGDVVDGGGGETSVNAFLGYHNAFTDSNGNTDYYAVIPDENPPNANLTFDPTFYDLTAVQGEQQVISHEMSEAITDPTPPNEWLDTVNDEVADMAANENYTRDGYEVQYIWSQFAPAKTIDYSMGTGANDLAITQLAPPAVDTWTGGPVASFVTNNTSLTTADFTAYVDFGDGFGSQAATISGGNGHFTISATPATGTLSDGQYGVPFNQNAPDPNSGFSAMYVFLSDTGAGAYDTGIPTSIRYVPYAIAPSAPMTYNADTAATTNDFRLVANGGDYDLYDNGQLVFTQPQAATTEIDINAVNPTDTLTVDYSGGNFAAPINWNAVGTSGTLSIVNESVPTETYSFTDATDGSVKVGGSKINYTGVDSITDTGTAAKRDFDYSTGSSNVAVAAAAMAGSDTIAANTGATVTFANPTGTLQVNANTGADIVTVNPLDSGLTAGLTVNATGDPTSTIVLNETNSGAVAATSGGSISVTGAINTGANGISLTAGNTITQTAVITGGQLATSSVNGTSLGALTNEVTGFRATNTKTGDIDLTTGQALTVTGITQSSSGAVDVASTGTNTSLTVNGGVTGAGGPMTLQATGNFTLSAGQTVNSTTGILLLAADLTAGGAGDDGVGTMTVNGNVAGTTITLQGAAMNIAAAANVGTSAATNFVTIRSSVESRPMNIGSGGAVAGINLTNAELARIVTKSSGGIIIGDYNQTGNITLTGVTAATTVGESTSIRQSPSGAGTIILNTSSGVAVNGNGGRVSFAPGTGGIQGTLSSTNALFSTTGFTATGLTLNLTLPFAPTLGTPITLISNSGSAIVGSFTNLPPNGSITLTFGVTSYTMAVSYTGGSGHNLTLTDALTTSTAVTTSANPSPAGQPVTFTATVTDTGGGMTPSGSVEFYDDTTGVDLGAGTLGSHSGTVSVWTLTTSALPGLTSPQTIRAVYTGTSDFIGSTGYLANGETIASTSPPPPPTTSTGGSTGTGSTGPTPTPSGFAIGSATGGFVSIFENGQELLSNFQPFGPIQGGVAAAVGDVNGDGVLDLVTVVASGGPAEVKVFNGATGALMQDFYAFPAFYTGGVSLALADLDGSGKDSIIFGTSSDFSEVAVFDGQTGAMRTEFQAYPGAPIGITVAAGQLDGSGKAQIVTAPTGVTPLVRIFNGDGTLANSFFAGPSTYAGGLSLAVGSLNGSGMGQIIVGADILGVDYAAEFNTSGGFEAGVALPQLQPLQPPPVAAAAPDTTAGMFRALSGGVAAPAPAPVSLPSVPPQLLVTNLNGQPDLLFTIGTYLGAESGSSLSLLGVLDLYPDSSYGPLYLG